MLVTLLSFPFQKSSTDVSESLGGDRPEPRECWSTVTGVVSAFDVDRGWGTVTSGRGGSYGFHCAQIADGSRQIDVGANVSARIVPGLAGAYEATRILPIEPDPMG